MARLLAFWFAAAAALEGWSGDWPRLAGFAAAAALVWVCRSELEARRP